MSSTVHLADPPGKEPEETHEIGLETEVRLSEGGGDTEIPCVVVERGYTFGSGLPMYAVVDDHNREYTACRNELTVDGE